MISEEQLRLAAQRAGKALAKSLPEPEDCHHEFSPEFERKMRKLIRKSRHPGFYKGLKRAACFLLVLLLSGGAFLTVNAEARELVFGWISEKFEDSQRYFHQGDPTPAEDIVHYQIDVPDEYWLESRYEGEGYINEYYVNEEGKYVNFVYQYITEISGGEMYIIDTESKKKNVFVHDMPADLYIVDLPENSNTVVWTDTETGALLDVTAYMDEDELIALAESVVPREE